MNDDKKKINHITLESTEINMGDINELYDQDIGHEYQIQIEELKYEEATDISSVISDNKEVINEVTKKPVVEVPLKTVDENSQKNNDFIEPVQKVEINKKVEKLPSEELEENKTENNTKNKDFVEPVKKKEKSADTSSLKSDKKIIKIAGIIALLLVIIVFILLKTRKTVEKASPIIKLVGGETVVLELDSKYSELGYFALDQEDGDITNKVTVIGEVDSTKPGIYKIKYKVLDTDRMKTEVYRNVIVISQKNDFDFKINGEEIVFINANANYVEEGYKATYKGKDISDNVQVFGKVDRSNPGNNTIIYALAEDNQVAVLKRTVVVFKGEEMDADADLITELNNWLIDELHYSNKISLDNVSTSALLYFGALNCRGEKYEIDAKELNSCLTKILNVKSFKVPATTKYQGDLADISYDSLKQMWVINKLELPRLKDNLFKIIVDNDVIYLYELYGYGVALNNREICDGNDNKVYYSGVDRNYLLGYESCKISGEEVIRTENYKKVLYVHTFKIVNGKYYWSTTEMIK